MAEAAKPVAKSGKERNLFGEGVSAPALGATGVVPAAGGDRERLKIVEDKRAGIRVQNLEEIPVKSADEVFAFVSKGIAKRATAETACNAQSSRSHCVFTLTIHSRESAEGEDVIKVGKLNLVDLAGSECVGRSGAKDVRAREAGNINQSLLTLGRVITALVDHLPPIPYRDSKLTRLLQDSNRAKNIKNRPEANARMEKRALITAYAGEIEALKMRLASQIAKDGVFMPEAELEALHVKIRQLEYDVEEMTTLKAANEEEIAALKAQVGDLRDSLDVMTERYTTTAAALETTTADLVVTRDNLASEEVAHAETAVLMRAHAATEGTLTAQAGAGAATPRGTGGGGAGPHRQGGRGAARGGVDKRRGGGGPGGGGGPVGGAGARWGSGVPIPCGLDRGSWACSSSCAGPSPTTRREVGSRSASHWTISR